VRGEGDVSEGFVARMSAATSGTTRADWPQYRCAHPGLTGRGNSNSTALNRILRGQCGVSKVEQPLAPRTQLNPSFVRNVLLRVSCPLDCAPEFRGLICNRGMTHLRLELASGGAAKQMSQLLIQQYLNDLQTLRRVFGSSRESVVGEAFKTLLKEWGRSRGAEDQQDGARRGDRADGQQIQNMKRAETESARAGCSGAVPEIPVAFVLEDASGSSPLEGGVPQDIFDFIKSEEGARLVAVLSRIRRRKMRRGIVRLTNRIAEGVQPETPATLMRATPAASIR
jgi:hypothetical protein